MNLISKMVCDIKQGKPLDFSFNNLKTLSKLIDEKPKSLRVRGIPSRGPNKRFLCGTIWLNNNNLSNLTGLKDIVYELIELPFYLYWLDVSFNEVTHINEEIFHFVNLQILYLHGNNIKDMTEVSKLKKLLNLRSLTLYGNMISRIRHYRAYVLVYLPQIKKLDFTIITREERLAVSPAGTGTDVLVNF
ncbi:leucine-rich repeat-containing protein 51-like [Daktulosphaira vitifoliae]|uniref:leucine-rich repeat-containing protein 51-like n=1 Tax=Daktulosphaira vitifoliae TaxID=58002 RepID=UPI0021A9F017|nr:leucine-rich repeat-containing protein 51-like [Daktulosphaira vitifoliae]